MDWVKSHLKYQLWSLLTAGLRRILRLHPDSARKKVPWLLSEACHKWGNGSLLRQVFALLHWTAKDLKMVGGKVNKLASSKFPLSIFKAQGKQRVNWGEVYIIYSKQPSGVASGTLPAAVTVLNVSLSSLDEASVQKGLLEALSRHFRHLCPCPQGTSTGHALLLSCSCPLPGAQRPNMILSVKLRRYFRMNVSI